MDKSFVTMEQHICPVCGVKHDTGALLLDRGLWKRFERYTVTGYGLCPEHTRQRDEGYVFVVGVESDEQQENPARTGVVVSIRREAFERIFDKAIGEEGICYAGPKTVDFLENLAKASQGGEE